MRQASRRLRNQMLAIASSDSGKIWPPSITRVKTHKDSLRLLSI